MTCLKKHLSNTNHSTQNDIYAKAYGDIVAATTAIDLLNDFKNAHLDTQRTYAARVCLGL